MDKAPHEDRSCLWQEHYTEAAYSSDAIVHLLSKEGFSSAEVQMLFQARGGFMSRLHLPKERISEEENRFLGAILSKLVLRGNPAACSLKVERYVLQKAQDAGLLVFEESIENGKIKFSCTPLINDFDLMLRICCLPELLVDDSEVDLLLRHYGTLLKDSEPAKRFFDKLMSIMAEKRLALFVVPCCLLGQDFAKRILKSEEKVDFVIQIPNLKTKTILKIAICVGDGPNCSSEADGWIIKRFGLMKQQYWESEARKLVDLVSYALPDNILMAAKQLRELPLEKKEAIIELISLPIAEAQLTQVMASSIYSGEKAEISIGNPQMLNLGIVMEAVVETIGALSSLYGIPCASEPRLADIGVEPDLEYYSLPTGAAFSGVGIIPRPSCSCHDSIQFEAIPRHIDRDDSSATVRKSLRFILNNIFRCQEFLKDQAELIEQMMSLQGSIGLLRPGGGKTLAYQLASILQPGIALVIVPNKYIAMDQQNGLSAMGIHRSRAILVPNEEVDEKPQDSRSWDKSAIFFLTADTLHDRSCSDRLDDIYSNSVNFLVFEEAHALSEWCHEFQPRYLNLARSVGNKCMGSKASHIALTSVNSRVVLIDIMNELDLSNPDCIVESASFDRKNLQYKIYKVDVKNRMQVLISATKATLREFGIHGYNSKVPSGLIFLAQEENEDMSLTSLSKSFGQYLNASVGVCSLKPPKDFIRLGGSRADWDKVSRKALEKFKRNELSILVCSADIVAGLNKEDVRFTLHLGIPQMTLEQFYQQSGPAGQDGMQSSCMIFFSDDCDPCEHEEIPKKMEDRLQNGEQLFQEFPGRMMEKRILVFTILKLISSDSGYNIGDRVDSDISIFSFPDRLFLINGDIKMCSEWRQSLLEKALYRLLLIGAIDGYEKRAESFSVSVRISEPSYIYNNYKKYIARYEFEGLFHTYLPNENASTHKDAVLQCACKLIDYEYHKIKEKKENEKAKMLKAVKIGETSIGKFRDYLHESMEQSVIEAGFATVSTEFWWKILEEIKGLEDLLGLFLACRQKLKRRPDDPVIRLILGFCELALLGTKKEQSNLAKGFCSLKHSSTMACRVDVARQMISFAELFMPSRKELILESILDADPSLEISRLCYSKSGSSFEVYYSSLFRLVNGLLEASNQKVSYNE